MSNSPLLSSAVKTYLEWLQVSRRSSTVAWYRHFLDRFVAKVGDIPLSTVNRLQIEMFSGKHHPLAALRAFFRWAKSTAKYIRKNPFKGIVVPKKRKRNRVLSLKELVLLRRFANRWLRGVLLALEEGGFRPHEVRLLAWEMIRTTGVGSCIADDLAAGLCYFQFDTFKASDRREDQSVSKRVPITPRLGRLLARMRRRLTVPLGYIFHSKNGKPWTPNALRCAWRRLRARVTRLGVVNHSQLVPYAFRHTKGTNLHRSGASAFVIRDWLGHVDLETTSIYIHDSIEELCKFARDLKKKRA